MSKETKNIIRIMEAGGNVIIENPSGKSRELLIQLAQTAVRHNIHLTIRKCEGFRTDTLVAVAQAGKGHVTFGV